MINLQFGGIGKSKTVTRKVSAKTNIFVHKGYRPGDIIESDDIALIK